MEGKTRRRFYTAQNGPTNGNRTTGGGPRTRGMEADTPSSDEKGSIVESNILAVDSVEAEAPTPPESSSSLRCAETMENCKSPVPNEAPMEVDEEPVESSSSSSSSDSSDSSDSESNSEMDEETVERKKTEFMDDLSHIEKEFFYLRELLYKERLESTDIKLEAVKTGKASEYLKPLEDLQDNMRIRIEIAGHLKEYRLDNMKNKFDAENLAADQNYMSEKALLIDDIREDLEAKISRLEEDRNHDFTSELWLETALKRKNKKSIDIFGEKRKKPVAVTGPYIVYMLNDVDIVEDWTIIKKAVSTPKRKYVEMVF